MWGQERMVLERDYFQSHAVLSTVKQAVGYGFPCIGQQ